VKLSSGKAGITITLTTRGLISRKEMNKELTLIYEGGWTQGIAFENLKDD